MADAGKLADSLKRVQGDARAFGQELAGLLSDTPLEDEEQRAWAELVPYMTLDELTRFRDMLLSHMERAVFDEAEDIILAMKAEDLRRQFAHAHNITQAEHALHDIEKEIDKLEGSPE